jgi:hypothetical protein
MKKYLFTTLVSNDLGLLTRSLPIAQELRGRGHRVAFCNPAKSPARVISDAGFENLPLQWNVCNIASGDLGFSCLYRLFRSKHLRRDLGVLLSTLQYVKRTAHQKFGISIILCVLWGWGMTT